MWDAIRQLDTDILVAVHGHANPFYDQLFSLWTLLGNPLVWMWIAALLYWKNREGSAIAVLVTMLVAGFVTIALKMLVLRVRPDAELFRVRVFDIDENWSFPSGHALVSASIWGYFWKYRDRVLVLAAGIAVLGIAFSRVYLGAHFPSDVVAGLLIGIVLGIALRRLQPVWFAVATDKNHAKWLVGLFGVVTLATLVFEQPLTALLLEGYSIGFLLGHLRSGTKSALTRGSEAWKIIVGSLGLVACSLLAASLETTPAVLALAVAAGLWTTFVWPRAWMALEKTLAA